MNSFWNAILARQLEAAMLMLVDVLRDCPPELWTSSLWQDESLPGAADFWYLAYHTLFWLDLYLGGQVEGFALPAPFSLDELDPAGLLPARVYSPEELLAYLEHCRRKAGATLGNLSEEQARRICRFAWGELPFAELLIDTLRHVQEHGGQLRMFLGQRANRRAGWVGTSVV